ncbi:Acyl-CoA synthetase (AMP-forming)/AMP-acid ligase II [Actinokineospora alba]|uniref:Acyl-CoA synthetase (AMP-forming)/AMP-acid ligase II n=2 Tax=Actinokineospora alba TaxID=504798 RepID=A0A1H0M7S7_9PSEU|nr:acyl-CoA synthetase (AMP-forming)/AMP-acid ligase II [Actinokineospora alba]SDI44363.1 Acyl-CoA synthetase (AMP-forming)/AMP-acid ligase II [Actinokineospora alba]SDO76464.1 Acyl-CoA synthetase (AMP-forming)/AMP-acid ligase II [Actinokineospora alba]
MTAMAEPNIESLADGFARQARCRPDAPALVWHDTEITYGELSAMAAAERARLDGLGLAPGVPVGVLAEKSPEAVALVLAGLLARRPVLLPSPALADSVLTTLFTQAGCATVVAPLGQVPRVSITASAHPDIPADTALLLTTSGSTGLPKIVPLGGQAMARFADWAAPTFGIGPGRSVLSVAPLNFDLCLLDVWTTLAAGGRVVLVDPARAANGRHLAEVLRSNRPHVVQAVPMFFALLMAAGAGGFDSVEHVMLTGDATPEHVLAGMPALFPKARLRNIYGCTETNDSLMSDVDSSPISIGDPLPGVSALLVDDGEVVRGSGTGELWVSTPFQTEGYLDRTRHTGKFAGHPTGANDRRYFRTGDLVRRGVDGRLFLVGRADFQVKVRGVAVNTAEVEHALLEHPDVLEAAVAAVPDPVAGLKLAAAVHRAPGSRLDSVVLREHCVRTLPRAAIPSTLRIADDPLPKTATGKVDRTAVGGRPQSTVERRVS